MFYAPLDFIVMVLAYSHISAITFVVMIQSSCNKMELFLNFANRIHPFPCITQAVASVIPTFDSVIVNDKDM